MGNLDLVEFLANKNNLQGPIPEAFWNNERLSLLRLDDNSLSGTISRRLGNLVDLTDLFLSNNTLQGTLPVTLLRLTNMGEYCVTINCFFRWSKYFFPRTFGVVVDVIFTFFVFFLSWIIVMQ